MDISKIPDSLTSTTGRQLPPLDLFRQITQLGSIEARVTLIDKGQALLNSQLGQILSSNSLDLKTGDRLSLRAAGSEQNPVLKITRLPPQPTSLNAAANQSLYQSLPIGKSMLAIVLGQQSGKTTIQLDNQQISIQSPVELKVGQLISLLKSKNTQTIELRSIDHQQVLKSALSQLLPAQTSSKQSATLTQLVKLIQTLVSNRTIQAQQLAQNTPQALQSSQQPVSLNNPPPRSPNLFSQLETLLSSLPQLSKLDKSTIQQWVRYLVTTGQGRPTSTQTTSNPYELLQQLPKSEAAVLQQLQQLRQAPGQSTPAAALEAEVKPNADEPSLTMAREIIKLTDQSLGQQLLQQTNLRLQQELQQPIALNLAIPLTDQQKIQELRLKIRQRSSEAEAENQSWDIHLDFEFGLLGLISTHLLLDGNTLSASFWSEQIETRQQIESNLHEFKQQLTRAGYDLGEFHSFPGKPPKLSNRESMAMPEALLDIRV